MGWKWVDEGDGPSPQGQPPQQAQVQQDRGGWNGYSSPQAMQQAAYDPQRDAARASDLQNAASINAGPGSPFKQNALSALQNTGLQQQAAYQSAQPAQQGGNPDAAIPAAGQADVARMEAASALQSAQPAQQQAAASQGMFGGGGVSSLMNRALGMQQAAAPGGAPAQQQAQTAPGGGAGMFGAAMRANALRRAISPWSAAPPPTANRLSAAAPAGGGAPDGGGGGGVANAAASAASSALRKNALTRAVGRFF